MTLLIEDDEVIDCDEERSLVSIERSMTVDDELNIEQTAAKGIIDVG